MLCKAIVVLYQSGIHHLMGKFSVRIRMVSVRYTGHRSGYCGIPSHDCNPFLYHSILTGDCHMRVLLGEPWISPKFVTPLQLAIIAVGLEPIPLLDGTSTVLSLPSSMSKRHPVSPIQKKSGQSTKVHTCWDPQCLLRISAGFMCPCRN